MNIGDLYIDEDDGTIMVVISIATDSDGGCLLYDMFEQEQWWYSSEDQIYLHRVKVEPVACC